MSYGPAKVFGPIEELYARPPIVHQYRRRDKGNLERDGKEWGPRLRAVYIL